VKLRRKQVRAIFYGMGLLLLLAPGAWGTDPLLTLAIEGKVYDYHWAGGPKILKLPAGNYRMFYGDSSTWGSYPYPTMIRSATSPDGLDWTYEGPVIGAGYGDVGGWTGGCDILTLPDGSYRMYFGYRYGSNWSQGNIMSAISQDGLNFTAEAGVRVDNGGTYDSAAARDPSIVNLPDGTLRMYYDGYSDNYRILSARSTDGLIWTKEEGVRLDLGPAGSYDSNGAWTPKVIKVTGGNYLMFYTGNGGSPADNRILRAVSTDGLNFTKAPGFCIEAAQLTALGYGSFPSGLSTGDIVPLGNNKYRLYFNGDRYNLTMIDRIPVFTALFTVQPQTQQAINALILD
jgi:hypothetical protein